MFTSENTKKGRGSLPSFGVKRVSLFIFITRSSRRKVPVSPRNTHHQKEDDLLRTSTWVIYEKNNFLGILTRIENHI